MESIFLGFMNHTRFWTMKQKKLCICRLSASALGKSFFR